jgi:hypothetical protein
MKFRMIVVMTGLLAAGAAQAQKGPKLVCWTDDKGARACGDHVPPQYAKQQQEVLDAQGRVLDTREREKTAEERKAADAAAHLAREADEAKQRQAEYDRFLVETYATEDDLAKTRDERIAALEGRIKLVDESIVSNQATLVQLHDRAAAAEKAKRTAATAPPPPQPAQPAASVEMTKEERIAAAKAKLAGKLPPKPVKPRTLPEQIADFEKSLAENQSAAKQLRAEREATIKRFDADIARWRQLKALPPG